MQRKYHTVTSSVFPEPSAGAPLHSVRQREKNHFDGGEIIVPRDFEKNMYNKESVTSPFVSGGKLLGRFDADDVMLLCIIFLLLQNSDETDMPLLLALVYIFLSDKNTGIF